ncbi:hypothetical protein FB45DRAFT_892114 [Roridomyces roridus]|uniref:Protein kinase domain-containing protein n=1 Tax=Roridomyces roridus TaxID=1738132 RepID=A0AAD7CF06_9AGAR|nr:hypothetical protein FB45DRAFT_892114 [Roridomyces roridus]
MSVPSAIFSSRRPRSIRPVSSFQARDINPYLVLEYMGGGDLLNFLIERDTFDEGFKGLHPILRRRDDCGNRVAP